MNINLESQVLIEYEWRSKSVSKRRHLGGDMNVGDYVRTKDGNIGKIEDIEVNDYEIEDGSVIEKKFIKYCIAQTKTYYKSDSCYKEDIYKSSPNIIDLIEIGDYVNGYLIEDKTIFGNLGLTHWMLKTPTGYLNERNIYTIVTKEQFESMEYEVNKQ